MQKECLLRPGDYRKSNYQFHGRQSPRTSILAQEWCTDVFQFFLRLMNNWWRKKSLRYMWDSMRSREQWTKKCHRPNCYDKAPAILLANTSPFHHFHPLYDGYHLRRFSLVPQVRFWRKFTDCFSLCQRMVITLFGISPYFIFQVFCIQADCSCYPANLSSGHETIIEQSYQRVKKAEAAKNRTNG